MGTILEFQYNIEIQFECPVTGHSFCLRCMPAEFPGQQIRDLCFEIQPCTRYHLQHDSFGNRIQVGSIEEPHDRFSYCVSGTAIIDANRHSEEPVQGMYRYASSLTGMSSAMQQFLNGLPLPAELLERAAVLMDAVHKHMSYCPGETVTTTTAADAFSSGRGVCQDYAHVYLALARASGIPARYVNGLTRGDNCSHAWCEIHDGSSWIGVDPTRGVFTDEHYIVFNRGRDFNDCPIERGVFKGLCTQTQKIHALITQQAPQ